MPYKLNWSFPPSLFPLSFSSVPPQQQTAGWSSSAGSVTCWLSHCLTSGPNFDIQVMSPDGKIVHLIIPAAQRIHNRLVFLCIHPSLIPPAPLPRYPLSVSSHQNIQLSHSWVTGAGGTFSLLRRFLNPSQAEPSQENMPRMYQCDFFARHHQHIHFGEG